MDAIGTDAFNHVTIYRWVKDRINQWLTQRTIDQPDGWLMESCWIEMEYIQHPFLHEMYCRQRPVPM